MATKLCVFFCFVLMNSVTAFVVPRILQLSIRSALLNDHADEILKSFGNGTMLNINQTDHLMKTIGLSANNHIDQNGQQVCLSSHQVFQQYSTDDRSVDKNDLMKLCPTLLSQLTKKQCKLHSKNEDKNDEDNEEKKKAWGFGFLFVTIISVGSLIGVFIVPTMNTDYYKIILLSMVSLAVGVLGGSAIFHLIPKTFGVPARKGSKEHLIKCGMIAVGVYIFLSLECTMKLYMKYKTIKKQAMFQKEVVDLQEINDEKKSKEVISDMTSVNKDVDMNNDDQFNHNNSSSAALTKKDPERIISPIMWMIVIGDGLHNFVDGLAIGASFTSSVIVGISTSLAVMSEELPHELGDFAILLNSGLTFQKAMLANFLSACCCYIGLVIGLVVGYTTNAVTYIYGIAAGMFLYISLVDMLPEAIEMAYSISGKSTWRSIKMLFIVHLAMLAGFTIMIILAVYGHRIKI